MRGVCVCEREAGSKTNEKKEGKRRTESSLGFLIMTPILT